MLYSAVLAAVLAVCIATTVSAGEKFSLSVIPGAFYGRYDGSLYRDKIQGASLYIEGRLATQWGIAGRYEHTRIKYKFGIPDFEQNAVFLSSYAAYIPKYTWGLYTFRLDLYSTTDNDGSYSADDVHVVSPQISYTRLDNSVYLDLGYADSRYGNSLITPGTLQVKQWTPTLGISLTAGAANRLKLRGYFIHSSNPLRSQDKTDTSALEVKYRYYPLSSYKLIPQYIDAAVLSGERIYAVDGDSANVTNLAELEKGGISLAIQWRLTKSLGLIMIGNRSKFREQNYDSYNDYFQKSAWLGLTTQW